jgi:hypothetical protein
MRHTSRPAPEDWKMSSRALMPGGISALYLREEFQNARRDRKKLETFRKMSEKYIKTKVIP